MTEKDEVRKKHFFTVHIKAIAFKKTRQNYNEFSTDLKYNKIATQQLN